MSLLTDTDSVESVKCDELEPKHSELDGKQVPSAVVDMEVRLIIEYNLWSNVCRMSAYRCHGVTETPDGSP